jgi:hypothetical protein
LALVGALVLGAVAPARAGESGDISAITTLSAEKLKVIDENRRSHPGVGWIVTSPTGQAKAAEYQKVLQAGDVDAVARSLVGAYRGDGIADEMEGLAMACLLDAGYKIKRSPWEDRRLHDKLLGAKKPDEKKLAASVLAIVDAIEKTGHQAAGETAVEFLLQVSTEGLSNLHNLAGNGMRKAPYMPHDVMARAAAYLDSDDPFVRAMAEWAVSASVCNETDQSKARAWPGEDPPAWYVEWASIDASDHLDLDYARQAMTLGMHRRGKDLLILARDQARRARERAAWARPRLTKAEADRQRRALAAMGGALDVLASAVTDAPARRVAWRKAFLAFRHAVRDVVLIGPDLDFEKIVYVERFSSGFHLQPGVHGRHHPAGGDIYVQTGLDPDSPREAVIGDQLSRGYVQDLDMWWDGTKVCFSYPDGGRLQKIYEIGLDGRGLRQITDGKFHDVVPTGRSRSARRGPRRGSCVPAAWEAGRQTAISARGTARTRTSISSGLTGRSSACRTARTTTRIRSVSTTGAWCICDGTTRSGTSTRSSRCGRCVPTGRGPTGSTRCTFPRAGRSRRCATPSRSKAISSSSPSAAGITPGARGPWRCVT